MNALIYEILNLTRTKKTKLLEAQKKQELHKARISHILLQCNLYIRNINVPVHKRISLLQTLIQWEQAVGREVLRSARKHLAALEGLRDKRLNTAS